MGMTFTHIDHTQTKSNRDRALIIRLCVLGLVLAAPIAAAAVTYLWVTFR